MKRFFLGVFLLLMVLEGQAETLVKVGISYFDPPFVIQMSSSSFDGFDIAMMNYVCRKANYRCEFVPFDRNDLVNVVAEGKVDVGASNLLVTRDALQRVDFSLPYLINTTHIIGLKKMTPAEFSIDLLNSKKIGVTGSEYAEQLKLLKIKDPKIKVFDHDDVLIETLNSGKINFALVDAYTANYWSIHSSGLIEDFGSPIILENIASIAFNKNKPEIRKEMNKALIEYRNSQQFLEDYRRFLLFY